MGEDRGQWEGECGWSGSRRVCGQRENKEARRRAIGIREEKRMTVIGIRDGDGRRKGGGQRGKKGVGRESLEGQ